jgi:hypothetical protein
MAMVMQIRDTSSQAAALDDYKAPLNMLRHLDEGGIPDHYTAEVFKSALADNQV